MLSICIMHLIWKLATRFPYVQLWWHPKVSLQTFIEVPFNYTYAQTFLREYCLHDIDLTPESWMIERIKRISKSSNMIKADLQQGVTISTPSPPRAGQRRHPLGSPLPPHLLLPPHRHHPPPRCLPGRWRDQPHPGQQAHGLSPDCSRGDQPAILPNNHAQHPLRLLANSCTSQIRHPGFSTIFIKI